MRKKSLMFGGTKEWLWAWHRTVVQLTGRESTGPVGQRFRGGCTEFFMVVRLSLRDAQILLPVWRQERWARQVYLVGEVT